MRAWALAGLMSACVGCANAPRWVRVTPVLKLIYRPYASPYLENPKFSFDIKRNWKGPRPIEGGVRFRHPRGTAAISISYHLEGSAGWKAPADYKRWLRQQGSTEDSHLLDQVQITSYTASRAVFTSHEYAPEYLLGVKKEVIRTELIVLPDEQGLFLFRYEAALRDFEPHRRVFRRLLESLTLAYFEAPVEE